MKVNQLLFSLLLALFFSPSFAQQVDTMTIDGEEVFVYPFKQETDESYSYSSIMDVPRNTDRLTYESYLREVKSNRMIADSMIFSRQEFAKFKKIIKVKSYRKLKKLYFPKLGPLPSKAQFDMYLKMRKQNNGMGLKPPKKDKDDKILESKKFIRAARANPYPFLFQSASQSKDLIPVLDPIPDGKYVQLYEEFCLVNEDGECEYISDRVAAYFTIKNNLMEGEATWVDLEGKTIKHGWFEGGLRTGKWEFITFDMGSLNGKQARHYIEHGSPMVDTTKIYKEYANGSLNGEYSRYDASHFPVVVGYYKDDEKVGQWTYRKIQYDYKFSDDDPKHKEGLKRIRDPHNEQITLQYTLNTDDSLIVKPIVIRDGLISRWRYEDTDFDFISEYSLISLPGDKYSPAFEREENLDLEEEEGRRDYSDEYMYDEEFYFEDEEYFDDYEYDSYSREKRYYHLDDGNSVSRAKLFDSIGAYPKYVGTYEAFYPNGQLAYRYDFDKGREIEPTIYWSNGQVHDQITFVADSNQYKREVFDESGELFDTFWYDSIGKKIYIDTYEWEPDYVELEGLKMIDYGWGRYYKYKMADSLWQEDLTGKIQLDKTWSREDSTLQWENIYYPETRELEYFIYSVNRTPVTIEKIQFSEDFKSWTGKSHEYFKEFEMEGTLSASFDDDWREMDSIPEREVKYAKRHFEITSDYQLLRNNEPYSGPLKLNLNAKKLSIKKGIVADLPIYDVDEYKLEKNIKNYLDSNNTKLPDELDVVNTSNYEYGAAINIFNSVARNFLQGYFESGNVGKRDYYDYYDYDYEYESYEYDEYGNRIKKKKKKVKKKDQKPRIEMIEGLVVDGKPDGVWTSYDQFGKKIVMVPFKNGEPHGKAEFYDYQKPESSLRYFERNKFKDSMPEERTYYLSSTEEYVNGKKEGKTIEYNWLGEISSETEYKDGMMHGMSMERNKIAISESEYKYGVPDGYLRTYLTLPDKDSILLYDLNFQDGMLQGESKSYHTNGKISKRGFFLSGEPIDDYEGYDSLGFRYHYVKFQYSYPIEEKIWEENELSVRYQFNWEDSIRFVPMDITESESLESLLIDAGLGGNYVYRPYYGRKRLVNKGGIDYHLTKYYPNDTVARDGDMSDGRKSGHWDYYSYEGEHLYMVDYFDSIIVLNDSIRFNSKGIYTEVDAEGNELYRSYIIEKFERYDCSHSDHYESRQLMTIWEASDTLNRMNGEVMNFYDNGTLQSAGTMKNGLPDGEWRFYDPNGKLNKYGAYVQGKRNGRWLSGDLSKTKYIGDICLNPNMPDIEEEIRYRENFLDIEVINYKLGKSLNREYYDINMNEFIEIDEESLEDMEDLEVEPNEVIEDEEN